MVTGYTARILEGCSFEEYMKGIICAFHYDCMNSEQILSRIEEEIKFSRTKLDETERKLKLIQSRTEQDWLKEYEEYCVRITKIENEYHLSQMENKEIFRKMLKKVQEWKEPAGAEEIKAFAISQIVDTIRYDCGDPTEYVIHLKVYEDFKTSEVEHVMRDVAYYKKEYDKCQKKYDQNEKLLKELLNSFKSAEIANTTLEEEE